MPRASRAKAHPAATPSAAALRLSGPSERLRAALAEHDKLVAKIARRRRDLDRIEAEARATVTEMAGRVRPLADEWKRLDAAVHALFDELLGARRSHRARSRIRRIYLDLQETGAISTRGASDEEVAGEEGPGADFPWGDMPPGNAGYVPPEVDAPSAPKHHDQGALRDLYRRLVGLIHPDQVRDEADKARRTEAMKEVTVAYRDKDFGRLLEIERVWAEAAAPPASDDDAERRLAAIETQNRELQKQLRALDKELRAMRRSPEGQMLREIDRGGGRDAAMAGALGEAEEELGRLREIHDFVARFRDGKMSLDDFMAGPAAGDEDDGEEIDVGELFADFMNFVEEQFAAGQPASRGKRGGRKTKRR